MVVNLTKLARYAPMTKSRKGQAVIIIEAERLGVTPDYLLRSFTLFLAVLVRRHTQNAVKTQKLSGHPMKLIYKPLSEKYNAKKPSKTRDKFWTNTEFLIKNLKVWQLKNGDVYVGYRGNAVHKGSKGKTKVKASQIMVFMERGTKKMPARPLFTVVIRNIAKNISFYLDMFIRNIDSGKVKL